MIDVPLFGRDLRARPCAGPRRGGRQPRPPRSLTRTASGPFRLGDATPLDDIRAAAAESPSGLIPILRPIDAGLEHLPVVQLSETDVAAIAKGQFVRPTGGLPTPAEHYRLVGPEGGLVAIATATAGRLAPDKVFVQPAGTAGQAPATIEVGVVEADA